MLEELQLLRAGKVARLLDVSERTLRRMVDAGDFPKPCTKVGVGRKGSPRWRQSDVIAHLQAMRGGAR